MEVTKEQIAILAVIGGWLMTIGGWVVTLRNAVSDIKALKIEFTQQKKDVNAQLYRNADNPIPGETIFLPRETFVHEQSKCQARMEQMLSSTNTRVEKLTETVASMQILQVKTNTSIEALTKTNDRLIEILNDEFDRKKKS